MQKHLNAGTARQAERGTISVVIALMFVPLSLFMAVVADVGRVWAARVRLQNGVESAATAVAETWIRGGAPCEDAQKNLVSANGAQPTGIDCFTTGTRRSGTVTVHAGEDVDLLFAGLVGRDSAVVTASTRVRTGAASSIRGLWPLALCAAHPAVTAWITSGFTSTAPWLITFQSNAGGCGSAAGNWAVLDFNGGSNSNSETRQWVTGGYDGLVTVGDNVPGNTGIPSSSVGVSDMVNRDVLIALFDSVTGSGSNASFRISGFVAARVVSVTLSSGSAGRNLTVRFARDTASGESGSNVDYGITSWSICSHDGHGECR